MHTFILVLLFLVEGIASESAFCSDTWPECPHMRIFCNTTGVVGIGIRFNCRKSCGVCNYCETGVPFKQCQRLKSHCNKSGDEGIIFKVLCQVTCGTCKDWPWWKLTWEAGGSDDPKGTDFSRKLHVPISSSGLTIGRGYDMKNRSRDSILTDLIASGVSQNFASRISKASHLHGTDAKEFITKNKLQDFLLTQVQQDKLFQIELARIIETAKRIFTNPDVVKKYGTADFDTCSSFIKMMVVDLIYRGDYTASSRTFLQPTIVAHDIKKLTKLMIERQWWPEVPKDRFELRMRYAGLFGSK